MKSVTGGTLTVAFVLLVVDADVSPLALMLDALPILAEEAGAAAAGTGAAVLELLVLNADTLFGFLPDLEDSTAGLTSEEPH